MSMNRTDQATGGADLERPTSRNVNRRAHRSQRVTRGGMGRATHLGGEILEEAVLADAVLEAELLPELHPDLVPALPHLDRDDLARHFCPPAPAAAAAAAAKAGRVRVAARLG
jgi:hypothetical protein